MFSLQESDFLMSSQCHILVNFQFTDTVDDHKRKTKGKRKRSLCHLLNRYF